MSATPLSRIVSDFETQLSGAISVGDTSFTLQSVLDADGETLSDGTYCFTIERDTSNAKEYLVGQLTASTKTVSSVQSVDRQGNLSSGSVKSHRIGSNVIISDHSVLSAVSQILNGVGALNSGSPVKYDNDPTLTSREELATVGYVLDTVTGGTVTFDRQILANQNAGETVAEGNVIYLKESDSQWWKADGNVLATVSGTKLGIALGAGTAGNPISGGVQLSGICGAFTGLTANDTYYLTDTAGAIGTTAGTYNIKIGQAVSTTEILLNISVSVNIPNEFISVSAGVGSAGKSPILNASGELDSTFTKAPIVRTYLNADSPATWTKPTGLKYVVVEVQGGGGGGGGVGSYSSTAIRGGSAGAGGYSKKLITSATLGATETVTIGAAGSGGSGNGTDGGTSSFGSHCSATGGTSGKGAANNYDGGIGGSGTGGDINTTGQNGAKGASMTASQETSEVPEFLNIINPINHFGLTYGAGGLGGYGYQSATSGQSGTAGIVIVTEYYN